MQTKAKWFLGKKYLILSFFKLFLVKFLRITLFLGGLELSFWAKTEFFKILGIWVIENPELSFSVLYKKSLGNSNVADTKKVRFQP